MIENIEEIKSQLDAWLVLQTIGYAKSNPHNNEREIRDFCPVHHGDNQRSLSINRSTGLGKCHSCGFEGDLIGLYMKAMDVEFEEAMTVLAPTTGIEIKYKAATPTNMPSAKRTPQQVLDESSRSGQHPYLDKQRVDACEGLYFGNDERGNHAVIVPFYNVDHELQTVQFVHNGKYFLAGYLVNGSFFSINKFSDGDTVYIAEGIATALTIWMALGKEIPVISFGSAGNLTHVIKALKLKYPHLKLVVCMDNNEAAFKQVLRLVDPYAYSYRLPCFEGVFGASTDKNLADFNDLISKSGQTLAVVKKQLESVLSFNDLPMRQGLMTTEVTAEEPSVFSTELTSDYELDVIHYVVGKSLNEIADKGFNPDEFDPADFNGSPRKIGKQTISLNRKILEKVKRHWDGGDADQALSITDISLQSGTLEAEVHALLKKFSGKKNLTSEQTRERLAKIKEGSIVAGVESVFKKLKNGGLIAAAGLELINKEIERGRSRTQNIQSDDYFESAMLEHEQSEEKAFIPTGFADFNLLLKGGLKGGKLITLQGKAGSGKSTFMIQLRDHLARNGTPVIFVSMEQTREELRAISKARIKVELKEEDPAITRDKLQLLCDRSFAGFTKNIFTIEGFQHLSVQESGIHFLTLSKIEGYVRTVIQQTGKKPVLFIDPFQRLSTGYKELDASEYDKINALVTLIKFLAIQLDITIIMASDVTKEHESNSTGEGSGRGSYMIQHLSDVIITFKESEQSAFEAIYGFGDPNDKDAPVTVNTRIQPPKQLTRQQKAVSSALKSQDLKPYVKLEQESEVWISAVVSKNRGYRKFSPLYKFKKGVLFKEVSFWGTIYSPESD